MSSGPRLRTRPRVVSRGGVLSAAVPRLARCFADEVGFQGCIPQQGGRSHLGKGPGRSLGVPSVETVPTGGSASPPAHPATAARVSGLARQAPLSHGRLREVSLFICPQWSPLSHLLAQRPHTVASLRRSTAGSPRACTAPSGSHRPHVDTDVFESGQVSLNLDELTLHDILYEDPCVPAGSPTR